MTRIDRTAGTVSARLLLGLGLLLLVVLGAPATALATRTIGLSSPTFDFNVMPGQSGSGELYVINDGTEALKVMVYAANQKVDASGTLTYETPKFGAAGDQGPASWFQIQMPQDSKSFGNTPYIEMAPGQRTLVKFRFEVPANATPGDHQTILFFEMFDFPQGGGMLSPVTGRVGSRVRIRVPGTIYEKLDVQPFSVPAFVIGDRMPYNFVLRNDSNVDKDVNAKLAMLDSSENELVSRQVVSDTVLYAQTMSERAGVFSLGSLGIGQFIARLTLTSSTDSSSTSGGVPIVVSKDRTVWVVPLWLVIAAAAVIGILILWLLWRAAVRAAERRVSRPSRRRRYEQKMAAKAGGPQGQPMSGEERYTEDDG